MVLIIKRQLSLIKRLVISIVLLKNHVKKQKILPQLRIKAAQGRRIFSEVLKRMYSIHLQRRLVNHLEDLITQVFQLVALLRKSPMLIQILNMAKKVAALETILSQVPDINPKIAQVDR